MYTKTLRDFFVASINFQLIFNLYQIYTKLFNLEFMKIRSDSIELKIIENTDPDQLFSLQNQMYHLRKFINNDIPSEISVNDEIAEVGTSSSIIQVSCHYFNKL